MDARNSLTLGALVLDATTVASLLSESMPVTDHYRCQSNIPHFTVSEALAGPNGYFRFGPDVICYGRSKTTAFSAMDKHLYDALNDVCRIGDSIALPFDPAQVVDNLRYERYVQYSGWQAWVQNSWVRDVYYELRPFFPVAFRKHLQRAYLRDWDSIQFPGWPVDRTVDILVEKLLVLAMQASGIERLPFIWFWPSRYTACGIVTHDVETTLGRDFCDSLMDIDDAYGIKASFQVVPEKRYGVPASYLQTIRDRGFEVNVQGLNHDGNLFRNRETFLRKAAKINQYAVEWDARGFRSPVLYRNIDWFQDLHFSYDMSVPTVARLEAQRGGCCTIMPYSLPGGVTELPITTTEDYTLFHVLKDYSMDLWKQQIGLVLDAHGLISFLVHPDYVTCGSAQDTYKALLEHINHVRSDYGVWIALPRDVDQWWRERSAMSLVTTGKGVKIEGVGSERACLAYAVLDGERLTYEIDSET